MLHRALPAASSPFGYALATCTARSSSTAILCRTRAATQHRVERAPVRLLSTAVPSAPIPTVIGPAPPRWKHLSDFADTPLDAMRSVARSRLKRALHAFNHSQCVRPSASAPAGTFVSTAECVWMWQQLSARMKTSASIEISASSAPICSSGYDDLDELFAFALAKRGAVREIDALLSTLPHGALTPALANARILAHLASKSKYDPSARALVRDLARRLGDASPPALFADNIPSAFSAPVCNATTFPNAATLTILVNACGADADTADALWTEFQQPPFSVSIDSIACTAFMSVLVRAGRIDRMRHVLELTVARTSVDNVGSELAMTGHDNSIALGIGVTPAAVAKIVFAAARFGSPQHAFDLVVRLDQNAAATQPSDEAAPPLDAPFDVNALIEIARACEQSGDSETARKLVVWMSHRTASHFAGPRATFQFTHRLLSPLISVSLLAPHEAGSSCSMLDTLLSFLAAVHNHARPNSNQSGAHSAVMHYRHVRAQIALATSSILAQHLVCGLSSSSSSADASLRLLARYDQWRAGALSLVFDDSPVLVALAVFLRRIEDASCPLGALPRFDEFTLRLVAQACLSASAAGDQHSLALFQRVFENFCADSPASAAALATRPEFFTRLLKHAVESSPRGRSVPSQSLSPLSSSLPLSAPLSPFVAASVRAVARAAARVQMQRDAAWSTTLESICARSEALLGDLVRSPATGATESTLPSFSASATHDNDTRYLSSKVVQVCRRSTSAIQLQAAEDALEQLILVAARHAQLRPDAVALDTASLAAAPFAPATARFSDFLDDAGNVSHRSALVAPLSFDLDESLVIVPPAPTPGTSTAAPILPSATIPNAVQSDLAAAFSALVFSCIDFGETVKARELINRCESLALSKVARARVMIPAKVTSRFIEALLASDDIVSAIAHVRRAAEKAIAERHQRPRHGPQLQSSDSSDFQLSLEAVSHFAHWIAKQSGADRIRPFLEFFSAQQLQQSNRRRHDLFSEERTLSFFDADSCLALARHLEALVFLPRRAAPASFSTRPAHVSPPDSLTAVSSAPLTLFNGHNYLLDAVIGTPILGALLRAMIQRQSQHARAATRFLELMVLKASESVFASPNVQGSGGVNVLHRSTRLRNAGPTHSASPPLVHLDAKTFALVTRFSLAEIERAPTDREAVRRCMLFLHGMRHYAGHRPDERLLVPIMLSLCRHDHVREAELVFCNLLELFPAATTRPSATMALRSSVASPHRSPSTRLVLADVDCPWSSLFVSARATGGPVVGSRSGGGTTVDDEPDSAIIDRKLPPPVAPRVQQCVVALSLCYIRFADIESRALPPRAVSTWIDRASVLSKLARTSLSLPISTHVNVAILGGHGGISKSASAALQCWHEMSTDALVQPDARLLCAAVRALCRAGDSDAAWEVWRPVAAAYERMASSALHPESFVAASAAAGFSQDDTFPTDYARVLDASSCDMIVAELKAARRADLAAQVQAWTSRFRLRMPQRAFDPDSRASGVEQSRGVYAPPLRASVPPLSVEL